MCCLRRRFPPIVKDMKHRAINPATVVMELPTTLASVSRIAADIATALSALVTDLKDLCEKEEPIYVGIAVSLACGAMLLLLDSWLAPFVIHHGRQHRHAPQHA